MRLLIPSLVTGLALLSCSAATPEWFSHAGFGVQLPAGVDPKVWMPRIAHSGAKYVVSEGSDNALVELAGKSGMMILNQTEYSSLGQWVPPGTLPQTTERERWESRFAIADNSGGATSRELIRLLIEVNSKGGNLLLTLPPRADDAVGALEEIGQWLHSNGESIFDTAPSPFDRMPFFGRATTKGNTLYLHLFQWPANSKLSIPELQNEIVSAELVGRSGKLMISGSTINLPPTAPHAAASVLKLTLREPAKALPYIVRPDQDGVITARAESCEFQTRPGMIARKDDRGGTAFLSHWTRAIDVPTWKVFVPQDGRYRVEVVYRAEESSKGVLFTITMKGATMGMVKGAVEPTGGASRRFSVSDMELEAGNQMLLLQPENKPGQTAMELEAVVLRRIGD